MNVVGNTLRLAEILETKNFSKAEAKEFLELLREETPSKGDLKATEERLENKIEFAKQEIENKIELTKKDIENEIKDLRKDFGWIRGMGGAILVSIFVQISATIFSR